MEYLDYDGGAGHHVDPAGALAPEEPVVALLPPPRAPRVLDDPEGHLLVEQRVLVLTKADNQHSMVNPCRMER